MIKSVSDNRAQILERIDAAAKRAKRVSSEITLIGVSKQQADERVRAALNAGQTVFGENKVQEAQKRWGETFEDHRKDLELRLIGPLQTNKAEAACKLFDVIETLDRIKLARALVRAAEKSGHMPRLLVQVNTGEEPQKSGVLPQELETFLHQLDQEFDIRPEGLMCIPPACDPSRRAGGDAPGPHFALLAKLAAHHGLQTLSMGMSNDYEIASEFGATHVRVGSALFGSR